MNLLTVSGLSSSDARDKPRGVLRVNDRRVFFYGIF
jgi:hypothetical protein